MAGQTNRLKSYTHTTLGKDLTAAGIVVVLLIPQSLAYAMLAGLPPEVGLYASVLPLIAYAILGSSRTLSVGPVAVVSLMTASALGEVAAQGSANYVTAAATLALLSGLFLLLLGLLRLGFIGNFLSHTVISGFISASGLLIIVSQSKHLLGINAHGDTLPELGQSLLAGLPASNLITALIGGAMIGFLLWSRRSLIKVLQHTGLSAGMAQLLVKAAPMLGVFLSILLVWSMRLDQTGVGIVGHVPAGLPDFRLQLPDWSLLQALAWPAIMISIIGYVESLSVGRTLAARRRQKVDANKELIGLGAANISAGLSSAFPVTGGFSRSIVNFDAGAETQMASVFAACGIALAAAFLTPVFYYLPEAVLGATIIVAVASLIDFTVLRQTWQFSRTDFLALFLTLLLTLLFGVEVGVASGLLASIGLHLYRTSEPHIAEVGLVEGTEHFRNLLRFDVHTQPGLLSLRIDESLYFANISYIEDHIMSGIQKRPDIKHVVLMCSAVNDIDFSALEALEQLNHTLHLLGVSLHLSEVKGPVMDKLARTGFLEHLHGQVYLTQYHAYQSLSKTS